MTCIIKAENELEYKLGFREIPGHNKCTKPYDNSFLLQVARKLYQRDDILDAQIDWDFRYYRRVGGFDYAVNKADLKFNEEETSFYLKNRLNGDEVFGLTLANILIGDTYRFIVGGSLRDPILAIAGFAGKRYNQTSQEDVASEEAAYSFGQSLELASTLDMGDRSGTNAVLTPDKRIVQLDFESIFSGQGPHDKIPYSIVPGNTETIERGRRDARVLMRKNLHKNRELIKAMQDLFKKKDRFCLRRADPLEIMEKYLCDK